MRSGERWKDAMRVRDPVGSPQGTGKRVYRGNDASGQDDEEETMKQVNTLKASALILFLISLFFHLGLPAGKEISKFAGAAQHTMAKGPTRGFALLF